MAAKKPALPRHDELRREARKEAHELARQVWIAVTATGLLDFNKDPHEVTEAGGDSRSECFYRISRDGRFLMTHADRQAIWNAASRLYIAIQNATPAPESPAFQPPARPLPANVVSLRKHADSLGVQHG